MHDTAQKAVFWDRELPPADAEITSPASSVTATAVNRCYEDLMAATHGRLVQEIARLGGDYAHVFDESISTRRNDAAGEAGLHGRFSYVLCRKVKAP